MATCNTCEKKLSAFEPIQFLYNDERRLVGFKCAECYEKGKNK